MTPPPPDQEDPPAPEQEAPPPASPAPLPIILGPTASGKTALALSLAARLTASGRAVEIVSFDSMQVYRGFDLGAAKPTAAELARFPHHFISEVDPREPLNAGEYARRARSRLREIAARGALPLLVGGTGFYLRALLEGLSPAPPRSEAQRARLRARRAARGTASLHRLLRRLDPTAAARIAPADSERAIRALEVRLESGAPLSSYWRQPGAPLTGFRPLRLGLNPPRAELRRRIDARAAAMFAPSPAGGAVGGIVGGIVAETAALLRQFPGDLAAFQAHGYKQAGDILRGADPALALLEAQQEQHRYAKRQITWFRAEPDVFWLLGFGDETPVQTQAADWLRRGLSL